jgi:RNA polymerase sigma-70 factor (ECF subfamily)
VCRVARRWNETRPEIFEELVQETYLHLCCKDRQALRGFQGEDEEAIFKFLKTVAANITHDRLRAQNAAKRGASLTEAATDDSESKPPRLIAVPCDVERNVLLSEIERWLDKLVSGRDAERYKTVFYLYFRQGMTAASIAQIPALELTTKGVESVLSRLTRALKDKISSANTEGQGA